MCNTDYDEAYVYAQSTRTARKEHRCYECHRTIKEGENYQYVFGLWHGYSRPSIFKTCKDCLVAQDWLMNECNGFLHGNLYEEILEHAEEYRKMFLYRWVIGIKKKWEIYRRVKS